MIVMGCWRADLRALRASDKDSAAGGDDAWARDLGPEGPGCGDGCAVVVPSTGDLPLLAVERGFRGRGAGSALLAAAARAAGARPLRAINVDAAAAETARFLRARGFAETAAQFEMELPLG